MSTIPSSVTFQGIRHFAEPVAVFKSAIGYQHFPLHGGPAEWTDELVLDGRSLASRIRNLRDQGIDTTEEERGLAAIRLAAVRETLTTARGVDLGADAAGEK